MTFLLVNFAVKNAMFNLKPLETSRLGIKTGSVESSFHGMISSFHGMIPSFHGMIPSFHGMFCLTNCSLTEKVDYFESYL